MIFKKALECVCDVMRCTVANIRINVKKTKVHLEGQIKTTDFFFFNLENTSNKAFGQNHEKHRKYKQALG